MANALAAAGLALVLASLRLVAAPAPAPTDGGPGHADVACAACHASDTRAAVAAATCLGCHDRKGVALWPESAHARREVACTACHAAHRPARAAGLLRAARDEEVCGRCHAAVRSRTRRASRHPVREGGMSCGSCHDPHGSTTDGLLRGASVNETCHACHAETRGPFLWEHAPAREDCGTCHEPHGSNHRPLLVSRVPWLCQRCHVNVQHPGALFDRANTGGTGPLGRAPEHACARCHRAVHGSNHPSGAYLER